MVERASKPRGASTSTDTHKLSSSANEASGDFQSLSPSIARDNEPEFKASRTDNHRYEIDPDNPGLLLIINQEEFYTEIDEEFKVKKQNSIKIYLPMSID